MILRYLIDGNVIHQESVEISCIPRIGDKVFIDEIFFVTDVVYFPKENKVLVYINDEEKLNNTSEIQVTKINNSPDVSRIESLANRALKETTELKRQLSSVRQQVRTQQNTTRNHKDTR